MSKSTPTQRLLFPEIFSKPVVVQFDQRQGSSDGGAVLMTADRRLRLAPALAACLIDPRQPGKVEHERFNEEKEPSLFTAVLRPGNAPIQAGGDRHPPADSRTGVGSL